MRRLLVLAVVAAIAGCGSSSEDDRQRAAERWCGDLQAKGLLLEPMSRCVAEYREATREP